VISIYDKKRRVGRAFSSVDVYRTINVLALAMFGRFRFRARQLEALQRAFHREGRTLRID